MSCRSGVVRRALVVVLTAALLAACGTTSSTAAELELPDLTLASVGASESAADLDLRQTGRSRVLNLWAIWCAPCRKELPVFDEVAPLAADQDIDVIGVNVGDTADQAQELIDELSLSFPQVLDPLSQVRTGLRITGMPATIFVAANGDVLAIHNGEVDRSELVELINEHFSTELS